MTVAEGTVSSVHQRWVVIIIDTDNTSDYCQIRL